ncbi:hypothetical protein RQP46_009949 [Phenoliferia psychrophenolica]
MAAPPHFDPTPFLAPYLYGALIGVFLTGLLTSQVVTYFVTYPNDKWNIKALVIVLSTLSIFKFACEICVLQYKFIDSFGNLGQALQLPIVSNLVIIVGPVINALCQAYFVTRAAAIKTHIIVLVALGVLILGTLSSGLLLAGLNIRRGEKNVAVDPSGLDTILLLIQISSWMSAITDICISSIFIFSVTRIQKPNQSFTFGGDSVLKKLLLMSFETAALTSLVAIGGAITTKLQDRKGLWELVFTYPQPTVFFL